MRKLAHIRRLLVVAVFALAACNEPEVTGIGPADSIAESAGDGTAGTPARTPRLVRCPTRLGATTTSIVGPLGGVLELRGSSITLPLGAVTVPTLMRLTVPPSRFMQVDITANDLPTFLFETPVTVTIDYSRCRWSGSRRGTLTVWHIDPDTKALLENMGGTDDRARRRITFTTGHLSSYAIAH